MATVLVTGFGRFPGAAWNPSAEIAGALGRLRRPGLRVVHHVMPVTWNRVAADLPAVINHLRPDAVLLIGLAGRDPKVRIEIRARNAAGSRLPDAAGRRPVTRRIEQDGHDQRRGTAPARRLLAALRDASVPARLSRDAGDYLCNFAYWHALGATTAPVVFVHVPRVRRGPVPSGRIRAARPSMRDLVRGAAALLPVLAASRHRVAP